VDRTALYYALSYDQVAKPMASTPTLPRGDDICHRAEAFGPFLFFSARSFGLVRTAAVLAFMSLPRHHLGFTMDIGISLCSAPPGLLPARLVLGQPRPARAAPPGRFPPTQAHHATSRSTRAYNLVSV